MAPESPSRPTRRRSLAPVPASVAASVGSAAPSRGVASKAGRRSWLEDGLAQHSIPVRVGLVALAVYLGLSAVLSAVGLLVVGLGTDGAVGELDTATTVWFEQRRFAAADAVASNLSNFSDTFTVLGVVFGASTLLLALRRWRELTVLVVAIVVEFTVFLTVNTIVGRPRPAVEPLESVPSTSSFPSGHIAAAIALYGAMAWIVRELSGSTRVHRVIVIVAVVAGVGVGASRVYLGLHHPLDVLAGAVLGVAALRGAIRAASMLPAPPPTRSRWLTAVGSDRSTPSPTATHRPSSSSAEADPAR